MTKTLSKTVKSGVIEESLSDYAVPTTLELAEITIKEGLKVANAEIEALTAHRDLLAHQLSQALLPGDAHNAKIVARIFKMYPEHFERDDFDTAFEEGTEKIKHK